MNSDISMEFEKNINYWKIMFTREFIICRELDFRMYWVKRKTAASFLYYSPNDMSVISYPINLWFFNEKLNNIWSQLILPEYHNRRTRNGL